MYCSYYTILIIIIILLILIINHFITINNKTLKLYDQAKLKAIQQNKKLMVLGSPTSSSGQYFKYITKLYGCGDVCIDMNCCKNCEKTICAKVEDILHKFPSNKYIVFEAGLLEVVDKNKLNYIIKQLYRIAGSKENIYASHYIQNNKWYYKNIYNSFYKLINEGNIERFVIKYPPINLYKFQEI